MLAHLTGMSKASGLAGSSVSGHVILAWFLWLGFLVFPLKQTFSSPWPLEAPANIHSGSSPVGSRDSPTDSTTVLTVLGHTPIPEPNTWAKECKLFVSAIFGLSLKKSGWYFLERGRQNNGQTKPMDIHCLCSSENWMPPNPCHGSVDVPGNRDSPLSSCHDPFLSHNLPWIHTPPENHFRLSDSFLN